MISGELIRIKNMVDDCVRLARSIRREAERLTPLERTHLADHVAGSVQQFQDLVVLLSTSPAGPTPTPASDPEVGATK